MWVLLLMEKYAMRRILFYERDESFRSYVYQTIRDKAQHREENSYPLPEHEISLNQELDAVSYMFLHLVLTFTNLSAEYSTPSQIMCDNNFKVVMREPMDDVLFFACISADDSNLTVADVERRIDAADALLKFTYGPSYNVYLPGHRSEWPKISLLLHTWIELSDKQQNFLIEAVEEMKPDWMGRHDDATSLIAQCDAIFKEARHVVRSKLGPKYDYGFHVMLTVESKVVRSSSSDKPLSPYDALLALVASMSYFPSEIKPEELFSKTYQKPTDMDIPLDTDIDEKDYSSDVSRERYFSGAPEVIDEEDETVDSDSRSMTSAITGADDSSSSLRPEHASFYISDESMHNPHRQRNTPSLISMDGSPSSDPAAEVRSSPVLPSCIEEPENINNVISIPRGTNTPTEDLDSVFTGSKHNVNGGICTNSHTSPAAESAETGKSPDQITVAHQVGITSANRDGTGSTLHKRHASNKRVSLPGDTSHVSQDKATSGDEALQTNKISSMTRKSRLTNSLSISPSPLVRNSIRTRSLPRMSGSPVTFRQRHTSANLDASISSRRRNSSSNTSSPTMRRHGAEEQEALRHASTGRARYSSGGRDSLLPEVTPDHTKKDSKLDPNTGISMSHAISASDDSCMRRPSLDSDSSFYTCYKSPTESYILLNPADLLQVVAAKADDDNHWKRDQFVHLRVFIRSSESDFVPACLYVIYISDAINLIVIAQNTDARKVSRITDTLNDLYYLLHPFTSTTKNSTPERVIDKTTERLKDLSALIREYYRNDSQLEKKCEKMWKGWLEELSRIKKSLQEARKVSPTPRRIGGDAEYTILSVISDVKYIFMKLFMRMADLRPEAADELYKLMLRANHYRLRYHKSILFVKAKREVAMSAYQNEKYPGLVHFFFVNRNRNTVKCPSLELAEGDDSLSAQVTADVKRTVWQLIPWIYRQVALGCTRIKIKDGDFVFCFETFLYNQDVYRSRMPPANNRAFHPGNHAIGKFDGRFYNQLLKDIRDDECKCLELLTVHLAVVPQNLIEKQRQSLRDELYEPDNALY